MQFTPHFRVGASEREGHETSNYLIVLWGRLGCRVSANASGVVRDVGGRGDGARQGPALSRPPTVTQDPNLAAARRENATACDNSTRQDDEESSNTSGPGLTGQTCSTCLGSCG